MEVKPCYLRSRGMLAFSLVEILVSLAIIALLAVILIPVTRTAINKAHTAACASNLHQIYVAMGLHATDHNGSLPVAVDTSEIWPKNTWMYRLWPYLEHDDATSTNASNLERCYGGVFNCPSKDDWDLDGPTALQRVSYGMNRFDPTGSTVVAQKLSLVEYPGETMLVADTDTGRTHIASAGWLYDTEAHIPLRHNGMDHMLMCDGHVEQVPAKGLNWDLTLKE